VPAKRFQGLALDLQVRLGLDSPPLIGVQGGQLVVDVQRRDRQQVWFADIREQIAQTETSSRMPIGVDLNGVLRFVDLANPLHAHVLVAGTSGSGKTEWLRTAIAGMMTANTPDSLRFVLIDPKRAAFGELANSPFLFQPGSLVYPDGGMSICETFDALIDEMEARYRAHQKAFVDDLRQFIDKSGERRARIVCICDEYADLVSTDRKVRREIEVRISRLGAKARAAGIHLVIATQRPSRDIVSGALQANMTCRVAMKMQSHIESRLLLGQSGAEHLLGHGDLLFQDIQEPFRLQAPLLPEGDRKAIFGKS
jgi:DNA segregation ATPase FtsK/SpoIIIE, S-DNA-T family